MVYRDKDGIPYLVVDIPTCTSRLEYFKYFFCCALPDVEHSGVIHQEQETQTVVKPDLQQHASPSKPKHVHEGGEYEIEGCPHMYSRQYREKRSESIQQTERPSKAELESPQNKNGRPGKTHNRNVRYGTKSIRVHDVIINSRPLTEQEMSHRKYLKQMYGNQNVNIFQDKKGRINEYYPEYKTRAIRPSSERRDTYQIDPTGLPYSYGSRHL